jgi:hypothetical protein
MKVIIKPKAESQDRITLRVSASLKKRMDQTRALADQIGADYYASIVDAIDGADQELREKLIQSGAKPATDLSPISAQPQHQTGDKILTGNGANPERR